MRPLFRLNHTEKHHPSAAHWFKNRQDPLGTIAQHWFEILRDCGKDVNEILHDGQPTVCVDGAAFAYVNAFTSHVNIGFFQGAELPDPKNLLEGSGKFMRHVKLKPNIEIETDALLKIINAAYSDIKERLSTE